MSNWDRVFGGTNEVSESDIASAQRRSNGNYARILDKQVRSDPLYRGTKPDALTRLALRNLELDRVAEQSKTTPTGLPYGQTHAADIPIAYDLRDPQQQVNAAVDGLLDVDPRTSRMLRDYKAGVRSIGDNPMTAVLDSPVRTVRDAALSGLGMVNPVEWFGGYGWGDIRDSLQAREREGLGAEDLGREVGRSAMVDTAVMAAMLPGMAGGLAQLGTGALNLGTKGLRALHQRLNTVPEARRLENISDINPGASTFSGRTFDPAAQAQSARKAAVLSGAVGAGAMGASDDVEAGSKYDPRAFLRYIQQNFPDMFDSAKQGMKFTADTGREAGVYGLLDDSMRIKPRMIIHGSTNSVPMPRDLRRELVDSANAFDMHTHPNDNALPSTPLNNASQNALGGDTQYYQSTGRGVPWKRPGRADNFIVSVQPRAIREPLDFGNGRGESWIHMKMGKYPGKEELTDIRTYLEKNADRYEGILPADLVDMGMMLPDDAGTFALLKHYADTGRGDFTYNLGKEVFGPGGRDPATPMYEAIYDQLRKDKQLRNYAGGGLVKSGLKMMFPNLSAPLHVVKPKGGNGNWLTGSVENALKGLRKDVVPYDHPRFNELLPEDQSRLNADGVFGAMHDFTPEVKARISEKVAPLNNWIEGPLTKYVKTRMASPEDEVRRLAEEGTLHFNPEEYGGMRPYQRRQNATPHTALVENPRTGEMHLPEGYTGPGARLGESELAARWEDISDMQVIPSTAGQAASTITVGGRNAGPMYLPDNPWLEKVDPKTPVYRVPSSTASNPAYELGFDHLIDELSNALDPNSGLPRHLQLTPEAVKQMSMEKAVRRVAEINAWRAAQIAEANGKIAGGPGQELVREYTHSPEKPNPKGLRWVELKKQTGDKLSDEQLVKAMEERGMYPEEIETALKDPKQRAQIEEQAFSDVGALADQLRYEGDTMGHCVGGYCDDVISGRSRIFSLRDAKGEPHVTVEVAPQPRNIGQQDIPGNYIDDAMEQLGIHEPEAQWGREEEIDQLAGDLWRKDNPDSQRIIQIKGKQNRKPNDEYLPFVQDFVKNPPHGQPWDEVGDLQNSGLRSIGELETAGVSPVKLQNLQQKHGRTYFSRDEVEQEVPLIVDLLGGKYASGGSVGVPAAGWELLTDPTGSPEENKLSWDIFSGHNDPEQLEAVQ